MTVKERLKQFLVQNFYISEPSELTDETSLVTNGLVDSTGMLEVISFLEAEFEIQVADQETTPENLDSISRMAAFVDRKRARAS
jgi:acyl carrier protein